MAVSAYVLIKCEGGMAEEVVRRILGGRHVQTADTLFGDYDAIAYLEVEKMLDTFSVRKLDEIVTREIARTKGVVSTNTHIVTTPRELRELQKRP
jgi:DNA-binding Lrp family transcriptional regulator